MNKSLMAASLLLALPALAQTGSPPEIRLIPAEEALFRQLVARDPAEPVALPQAATVGAMIPLEVELQRFPGGLMAEVPSTRALRYLRTTDGIVVVDPDTRRVVQIFTPTAQP